MEIKSEPLYKTQVQYWLLAGYKSELHIHRTLCCNITMSIRSTFVVGISSWLICFIFSVIYTIFSIICYFHLVEIQLQGYSSRRKLYGINRFTLQVSEWTLVTEICCVTFTLLTIAPQHLTTRRHFLTIWLLCVIVSNQKAMFIRVEFAVTFFKEFPAEIQSWNSDFQHRCVPGVVAVPSAVVGGCNPQPLLVTYQLRCRTFLAIVFSYWYFSCCLQCDCLKNLD